MFPNTAPPVHNTPTKAVKGGMTNSSPIQTVTVGFRISRNQSRFLHRESRAFTAGREFHPALKNYNCKCISIIEKMKQEGKDLGNLFWF